MSTPVPSWPDISSDDQASAPPGPHPGARPFGQAGRGNLATAVRALPVLLGLTLARGAILLAILLGTLAVVAAATLLGARAVLG